MNKHSIDALVATLAANDFELERKGGLTIYRKDQLEVHIHHKSGSVEIEHRGWALVLSSERDLAYLLIGYVEVDSLGRALEGGPEQLVTQILNPSEYRDSSVNPLWNFASRLFKPTRL